MSRPAAGRHGHLKRLLPFDRRGSQPNGTTTIVIPTIADSPTLDTAIAGWRWQNTPATIILIDTGTDIERYQALEAKHAHATDVRIVRLAPRDWNGLSARVAAAIDLATAIVDTTHALLTHDDVFPKRRDIATALQHEIANEETPVVGYEMSPRSHITNQWQGMVSHTLTLIDVDDIRSHNLRWSLADAIRQPECENHGPAWPDTETGFGIRMRQLGLTPRFIGHETNDPHFEDDWIVHRRSLTSHRFLWPDLAQRDADWQQQTIRRFAETYNGQ